MASCDGGTFILTFGSGSTLRTSAVLLIGRIRPKIKKSVLLPSEISRVS